MSINIISKLITSETFNKFVNVIHSIRENASVSLPEFTKPFMIESPIFIQNKIFIETDILDNLISTMYDLYTGYVLLAVKLDSYIEGSKKVRDVLSTVSTSSYTTASESLYFEAKDIVNKFSNSNIDISTEGKETNSVMADESRRLLSGRLIETVVYSDDKKSKKISIPLYIKLNPRVFPDSIVDSIVSANIKPSIFQRWFQYKTGEISFIKDFLMQLDLVKKRSQALKHDKSNIFYDIMYEHNKGILRRLLKLVGVNSRSQNLCNSIFLFDRYDLKKACSEIGMNFDRYVDRNKFFSKVFSMIVGSVDIQYGLVDVYINSIKEKGEYTFSQIDKTSKKGGIDIVDVMKMLSQQRATIRMA